MKAKDAGTLVEVDRERDRATIGLKDLSPKALFVSKGEPALLALPDYGEITIKIHEGKITYVGVNEKYDFGSLAIK